MLSVNNYILILSVGIFVGILIPSVLTLKCYVCDEQNNSDCRNNVQKSFLEECYAKPDDHNQMMNATGCAKIYSTHIAFSELNRQTNVKRACYYGNVKSQPDLRAIEGCNESNSQFSAYNCTLCTENACNDSSIIYPGVLFIYMLLLVIQLF